MSELKIINQLEREINFKLTNLEKFAPTPRHVNKWDEATTTSEFLNVGFRLDENLGTHYDVKFELGYFEIKDGFIRSLVLINQGLKDIPKSIFKLKRLKKLILNSNLLTSIDGELSILKELQFLDLSNNNIKNNINLQIQLPNLLALDLSYNDFNNIELNSQCLPNLCSLFLSGTKIKSLNKSIIELTQLWLCHDKLLSLRNKKNEIVRKQKYEEAAGVRDQELKLIKELKTGLYLFNCSISNMPPEVLKRGTTSISNIGNHWKEADHR